MRTLLHGPDDTLGDVCGARAAVGDPRAWIRRLGAGGQYGDNCFCNQSPDQLVIETRTPGEQAEDPTVAELKHLFLYSDRKQQTSYNPLALTGGRMQQFHEGLATFQGDHGLTQTGSFAEATWGAVLDLAGCV